MTTDLFDLVADRLEQRTDLDRLEARGTLRIAFKKAGVDSKAFGLTELRAVFEKIMPGELEKRAVSDAEAICSSVLKSVAAEAGEAAETSAASRDEIIRRLGRT